MKNNHCLTLLFVSIMLTACSDEDVQVSTTDSEIKKAVQSETKKPHKTTAEAKVEDGIDAPLVFTLTDLEGQPVKASDFRGKWLILNYWATWCAPCRDEMPELVKFQAENQSVQILGIAYEDAEVDKLKHFAADFNINYPLLTMDVYNPPAFAQEGGLGLPTTIVYTPEGMRHKKHMGPIDAKGLMEMIQ